MAFRIKHGLTLVLIIALGWGSYNTFNYFFDDTTPKIALKNIESNKHYAGTVNCAIISDKKGTFSVWLDDKEIVNNATVQAIETENPFTVPTNSIANGNHTMHVVFTDKKYRKNKTKISCPFFVDNTPLQAALVTPESNLRVLQGRTLHLQCQVNKPVESVRATVLSKEYECFPESERSSVYECYVPIECEENPNEHLITVSATDKVGNTVNVENKFQVTKFAFVKQPLHVKKEKVIEEKQLGLPEEDREKLIAELASQSPKEKIWKGAFVTPIEIQRTTCEFGAIRTTQEKGRYKHKALDVINLPKSVVWSTADGIVVAKERYWDSGNTVIIDHGWGVLTLYYHLDDFANIEVGQKIAQGKPVGTLGKTGYASGYHLHWEMRVNNIQVDPIQWTKADF